MTQRNLNPYAYFERLAATHRPTNRFDGTTRAQFDAWKKDVLPKALATLGRAPAEVPANPQLLTEWREDGLIKQRWLLDVQPGLSATMLLFRPENLKPGERRPAILCCHGHGALGKDGPMGVAPTPASRENIRVHNYDYGLQMAQRGFITYSLDWLGFGERNAMRKPNYSGALGGEDRRDPCNIYYLCATMLGTTPLAMNLSDAKRVTDFVCAQSFVDPNRLGVMGLSLGGTMTTWVPLYDSRFKAANIFCYAGSWHEIAYRTYNVCGSQVTPGIYAMVDVADLQGLLAPLPLLVEIGLHDSCFHADHSQENYKQIEKIYKAAGAGDRLQLDLFPGEHAWGGNKSVGFFCDMLGAEWPSS